MVSMAIIHCHLRLHFGVPHGQRGFCPGRLQDFSGVHQPPRKSPRNRAKPPRAPARRPSRRRARQPWRPATTTSEDHTVKPPLQRRSAPGQAASSQGEEEAHRAVRALRRAVMTAWTLKQHEQGRRHRNMAAQLAGDINVRCPVCNVHLSSGSTRKEAARAQQLIELARMAVPPAAMAALLRPVGRAELEPHLPCYAGPPPFRVPVSPAHLITFRQCLGLRGRRCIQIEGNRYKQNDMMYPLPNGSTSGVEAIFPTSGSHP
ncbi:hypothetical protein HU200_022309 [Digitaria exilis]|uniref:Uncharacterized protein n=1 Tax=Digitaria exilis TaxID=1010633 RepID=A0A835C5C2_9POAL|nr:hypothetical protein HU200_022309 [Digitaria exilis]